MSCLTVYDIKCKQQQQQKVDDDIYTSDGSLIEHLTSYKYLFYG